MQPKGGWIEAGDSVQGGEGADRVLEDSRVEGFLAVVPNDFYSPRAAVPARTMYAGRDERCEDPDEVVCNKEVRAGRPSLRLVVVC